MNSDELKEFVEYKSNPLVTKRQIRGANFVMVYLCFLNIVFLMSEKQCYICGLINILIVFANILLTYSRKAIIGERMFFIAGVQSAAISATTGLFATEMVLMNLSKSDTFLFICIILMVYIGVIFLYGWLMRYIIKKKLYRKEAKIKSKTFFVAMGIVGMFIAKSLANGLNDEQITKLIVLAFYIVSFISMFGTFNFVKYYYLRHGY